MAGGKGFPGNVQSIIDHRVWKEHALEAQVFTTNHIKNQGLNTILFPNQILASKTIY